MLARKDINAIWFELRDCLDYVESKSTEYYDDDFGIVTPTWDEYKFIGNITYKGEEISFYLIAKYDECSDKYYDIKVIDWDVEDNEDYFKGYDEWNARNDWYQLADAFENAERHKHKK
jgi:hypothetical protein